MNNPEQIAQILTTVLIAMLIILGALVFVYLTIFFKNKNKEQKLDKNDVQKNKEKAKSEKASAGYGKQSIFDFMEFDKIEDNMIVQKNGLRYVMVLQCQGVNYDLLSEAEKHGVEEGFLQFLNTLRAPIQIYIQTRTVNLDKSLEKYKENVDQIERELAKNRLNYENNRNLGIYSDEQLEKQYYEIVKQSNMLEYGKDIINNTERMSKNRNVLNNKYYIVIYYYPEELDENVQKYEIQDNAFSELYTRAQTIMRTLYACSVNAKVMNSNELAELLYVAYNRDESETFDFEALMRSGYTELYSTAQDIWDKKIKRLNKEIEERAIDIANETIEQVKSERQKQYELKSDNLEDLAREMAALIIDENDDYVGKDIAKDAIEALNSKMNELEEVSEDEEKENRQSSSTNSRPREAV